MNHSQYEHKEAERGIHNHYKLLTDKLFSGAGRPSFISGHPLQNDCVEVVATNCAFFSVYDG